MARNLKKRAINLPALFKFGGKCYLFTSGSTGWTPDAANLAVTDTVFGAYNRSGNPCIGPESTTTFRTQNTSIAPGKPRANSSTWASAGNPKLSPIPATSGCLSRCGKTASRWNGWIRGSRDDHHKVIRRSSSRGKRKLAGRRLPPDERPHEIQPRQGRRIGRADWNRSFPLHLPGRDHSRDRGPVVGTTG